MSGGAAALPGRELGGALRDQGVLLAHEYRALAADVDDDLPAGAERVGDRSAVAHRDGGRPVAVADPEQQRRPLVLDGPRDHLSGELVGASGVGAAGQLTLTSR